MGETVDVLVTGEHLSPSAALFHSVFVSGGEYGSGKRSGGVSSLVCSVLDDRRPEDDEEPK
jgi:hypothetical protein